jgi:hypothetical protein
MILKFLSEKGEIFEDTPFGSWGVSYLIFLQELFRFISLYKRLQQSRDRQ